jgi:hypothetical protein
MLTRRLMLASSAAVVIGCTALLPSVAEAASSGFTIVASPQIRGADLMDVSASGASSVWAVGSVNESHPLVMRYDGVAWTRSPLPRSITRYGVELLDVKAFSSTNVWAVGDYVVPGPWVNKPLVIHWNGRSWTRFAVPLPPNLIDQAVLTSISGSSPRVLYAAGSFDLDQLVERWNGRRWSIVKAASPPRLYADAADVLENPADTTLDDIDNILSGVGGRATNLWAVGQAFNRKLVGHADGRDVAAAELARKHADRLQPGAVPGIRGRALTNRRVGRRQQMQLRPVVAGDRALRRNRVGRPRSAQPRSQCATRRHRQGAEKADCVGRRVRAEWPIHHPAGLTPDADAVRYASSLDPK